MNAKYLISRWHLPKSKAIVILQNSEKYTRHYWNTPNSGI